MVGAEKYSLVGLRRAEIHRLCEIDRAETVENIYVLDDGQLRLVSQKIAVSGWNPVELKAYVRRLRSLHDRGGLTLGAFSENVLLAIGSLDYQPVGGDSSIVKLDMLHVSRAHRGRGIGRALTGELSRAARVRGASSLYISATPTQGTVDMYMRLGARPTLQPDPTLLAMEPDDIHLILSLVEDDCEIEPHYQPGS